MQRLATAADALHWLRSRLQPGAALQADHRRLRPGDAFLAWPGRLHDGRLQLGAALQAGAAACLVEAEGAETLGLGDAPALAALPGLKAAAGLLADGWYGQPSAQLQVLAVTGTNGKTSSACWLAQALAASGRRCGVVGTLGIGLGGTAPAQWAATGLTSPDAPTLHAALAGFVAQGCGACAIEASSIGLADARLAGMRIAVALFTNFTRDHLDWHGDMAAYWAAKRSLFDWPGLRAAVVNVDDPSGAALASDLQPRADAGMLDLWTVSRQGPARLQAVALEHLPQGLAFTLQEAAAQQAQGLRLQTRLLGEYNVSNLLGVAAGLRALGLPLAEVGAALAQLEPVPGRLEPVRCTAPADIELLVDYAHTPDALEQALRALQPLARARGGRLWCLFGCGGNRDASKRPLMGAIAEREADIVLITSDNPRDEDPQAILQQIAAGLRQPQAVIVQAERRAAIARAVAEARSGDVLLLAGKGHEDYQEIAGRRLPFSDLAEARAALAHRCSAKEAAA